MVCARNRKPNSDVKDDEIEWQVNFREDFTLSRTTGTGMQTFGKILLGIIFLVLAIYLIAVIINKAAGGDKQPTSTPPMSAMPSQKYISPAMYGSVPYQGFSM